jgi:hypothetical protein
MWRAVWDGLAVAPDVVPVTFCATCWTRPFCDCVWLAMHGRSRLDAYEKRKNEKQDYTRRSTGLPGDSLHQTRRTSSWAPWTARQETLLSLTQEYHPAEVVVFGVLYRSGLYGQLLT